MTLPINIKVNVLPRFPAQVIGRIGLEVTKSNGIYYFDLDYTDLPAVTSIPSGHVYTAIWNSDNNTYQIIPLSSFTYIEAPNDANTYGRHALAWVPVLTDAPSDSNLYGRKNGTWTVVPGGMGDAPSDGTLYGRKNAVWTPVPSGGASVTISDTAPALPAAGNLWWNSALGEMYIYYNDGTSSQWVAITTAQAVGSGGGTGGGTGGGSFTTNIVGAGTYIVPSGKTTLVGEAWGGGGGGRNPGFGTQNGGGGGGYSKFTATVTPGQTIYYNVGPPGAAGSSGSNSWVNPTANSQPTSNGCVGGGGGAGDVGIGGGGNGSIGTTNFQGGNGFSGTSPGGGGGGGAGSSANGVAATSSVGGAGGAPDGGAGSNGVSSGSASSASVPGGGGGSGNSSGAGNGGAGGTGQVRLTFS